MTRNETPNDDDDERPQWRHRVPSNVWQTRMLRYFTENILEYKSLSLKKFKKGKLKVPLNQNTVSRRYS